LCYPEAKARALQRVVQLIYLLEEAHAAKVAQSVFSAVQAIRHLEM
jgi:hypothetical protein